MGYRHRILFLEDDQDFHELSVRELRSGGLEFESALAADKAQYAGLLGNFRPDVIISDYFLPDINGAEALEMARQSAPLAPFIVLSGTIDDRRGQELEKAGAFKYLPKDRLGRLPVTVARALDKLACARPRILFLEDDAADYELERAALEAEGINFLPRLEIGLGALGAALEGFSPDLIISDYLLRSFTGLDVMDLARELSPRTPVIVVSGAMGEEKAAELFRAGAADYILKDKLNRLGPSVRRVLAARAEMRKKEELELELRGTIETRNIMLEAVSVPFFMVNGLGSALAGNTAAAAVLGLPELEGADVFGAPGEYSAEIKKAVLASAESAAPVTAEHKAPGGRTAETHVYPLAVRPGEPRRYVVISLDVTRKKRDLERLERINAVLAGLGAVYGENVNKLTELACRLLGADAGLYNRLRGGRLKVEGSCDTPPDMACEDKAEGHICHYIITHPAEDRFELLCDLQSSPFMKTDPNVSKYGLRTYLGYRIRLGESVVGSFALVWRRDFRPEEEDIKLLGIIASAVEAEERRRQRQELLRDSEARYRTLYESSRDALMTLFPPDWRFASGNPATLELFGAKDEADFTSRAPWDVSPEHQPGGELSSAKARRMIESAMENGSNFFEWTHKKIGGPDFPATVLLTRFELGGKAGLQGTVRDISAQKLAEAEQDKLRKQLLQSQKMETVGLLAGGVAHDFNNILSAIMCYAGFIVNDLPADHPRHGDLKEIMAAAERAASLTHQLLAFSRRQILAPRIVDVNGLVGGMTRLLRRVIGENIRLEVDLHHAPCLANVDPGQIEQVIMNMVVNSRDAISGGGTITLETEIAHPPESFFTGRPDLSKGPLVCLRVRDTGCGMNAEVKSRLFEPFFTTKEMGKGTGLGLSTVFGIVKQSRGEVDVESEPGKGAVFSVYLPFAAAQPQEADKDKGEAPSAKGHETVLFVEDEDSLRRLGERVLRSGGYNVITAANGKAAIRLMEERGGPVDLLITDVVMPGMSGRELAKELERRKLVSRTLYMSGYTDDAIVKHGVLEPGLAFMYKPFTVEGVMLKLREVLDGPADQAKA